jgi:hypothetical protein
MKHITNGLVYFFTFVIIVAEIAGFCWLAEHMDVPPGDTLALIKWVAVMFASFFVSIFINWLIIKIATKLLK